MEVEEEVVVEVVEEVEEVEEGVDMHTTTHYSPLTTHLCRVGLKQV